MRPAPHPLEADLSAYLDGELPAERRRMVEAWLAESDEARRRLAELRAVADRLAALPRLQAPDALAAALARAVEQRQLFGEDAPARWFRLYRMTWRLLSAAAVLLAAVGIGYYALRPGTGEPPAAGRLPTPTVEALGGHPEALVRLPPPPEAGASGAADPPTRAAGAPGPVMAATMNEAGESAEGGAPDAAMAHGPGGLPSWHGLSREAGAGGAGRATIDVTITPTSAVEYAATLAVLNDWDNRGLAATADGGEPVARQIEAHTRPGGGAATVVEQVYSVDPGDLSYRLNQLALNAPQQVFVQMNFVAAPDDILSQVSNPAPEPERFQLFSISPVVPAEELQGEAVAAHDDAHSVNKSAPRAASPAPAPAQTEPAGAPDRRRDRAPAPEPPGGGPPEAPAARANGTGAPPLAVAAPAAPSSDKAPLPASQPAPTAPPRDGPPGTPPAARDADRSADAASPLAGEFERFRMPSVAGRETRSTQRLLNLLLRGQQPVRPDDPVSQGRGRAPGHRGNVAGPNVLFRVRVLPPLGGEAAVTAAVGPPAELANTATMPAAEATRARADVEPVPPAESR